MTVGRSSAPRSRASASVTVKAATSPDSTTSDEPSLAGGASRKRDVAPPGAPPLDPPPFSIADVRRAIPAHFFERSAVLGFAHLARDLIAIALIAMAHMVLQASALPAAVKLASWPVYWYLAGSYMTGVWVIAHECGHQAFSASRALNDAVGLVLVRAQAGQPSGDPI